ncbi:hypothetical protein F2Q69_00042250 [Brassica cretica]|uniref:Uncharacterized protein n=1 Tax=Brassica cretica TaxID=69181 RepID=A0A8S9NFX0_BRACR|nr:hypothetical protein F2Q69_00042250 [Brassica cretica]
MFPRTVPSEISKEIPTNNPRKIFLRNVFGIFNSRYSLGISRRNSEKNLFSGEKFPTTILVGMSLEYRYSEDIPTIFVVGIPVFSCSVLFRPFWLETSVLILPIFSVMLGRDVTSGIRTQERLSSPKLEGQYRLKHT